MLGLLLPLLVRRSFVFELKKWIRRIKPAIHASDPANPNWEAIKSSDTVGPTGSSRSAWKAVQPKMPNLGIQFRHHSLGCTNSLNDIHTNRHIGRYSQNETIFTDIHRYSRKTFGCLDTLRCSLDGREPDNGGDLRKQNN